MDEKRSSERRTIFYYLSVLREDGSTELGKLCDISENGVLLITDSPEELKNEPITALIILPPQLQKNEKVLKVKISKRWSKQDKNPLFYLVGCTMESAPEQQETIGKLIELYAFSDGYKDLRKEMNAQNKK